MAVPEIIMFKLITKIKTYFILRNNPISPIIWGKLANSLPLCRNLEHKDLYKLKKLTTLFLYEKTFTGVKDFELDEEKKMIIFLISPTTLSLIHSETLNLNINTQSLLEQRSNKNGCARDNNVQTDYKNKNVFHITKQSDFSSHMGKAC